MTGNRITIAFVMKLTALVAVNLAFLVESGAALILQSPPTLFTWVVLNLLAVQVVILRRPLGAFHYVFVFNGALSAVLVTVFVYFPDASGRPLGSLRVIETLIRWSKELRGEPPGLLRLDELVAIAPYERCLTSNLSLLPSWWAGLLASRWVKGRGGRSAGLIRGLMAFAQGAIIGFAVFALGATHYAIVHEVAPAPHSAAWYAHTIAAVGCPLLFGLGLVVLTRRPPRFAPYWLTNPMSVQRLRDNG